MDDTVVAKHLRSHYQPRQHELRVFEFLTGLVTAREFIPAAMRQHIGG